MIAWAREALLTINTLLGAAVIYLALAVSKLRSDMAHLRGRLEQHDRERRER